MIIGVLALQGAFLEHQNMLSKLDVESFQIRKFSDLKKQCDGLILPGGESTTICKLLNDLKMLNDIKSRIENGLPVFGTCAGLILLAKHVSNCCVKGISTMDITCNRNAYGRQISSFKIVTNFGNLKNIPMVFIRAPYIEHVEKNVEILSRVDGKIVAAKQKNQLVTAFHPELTQNTKIHEYFLEHIVKNKHVE